MLHSDEAQNFADGDSSPMADGSQRASRDMAPGAEPLLSVAIVNWNTKARLRGCLTSIGEYLDVDHEVLVVDNASVDGSAQMIEQNFPEVHLIRNSRNLGFATANNQAMNASRGSWLLLLNSDTELVDESVARLVELVRTRPDLGVAHCRQILPDGRLQHSTYRFPSVRLAVLEGLGLYKLLSSRLASTTLLGQYWFEEEERDVDWVSGAFMLLPRKVFETTGGFDERLFMYGEDMEWCRRIRSSGWRIRSYPQAAILHYDHTSADLKWADDERFALCVERERDLYARWKGPLRARMLIAIKAFGVALRIPYFRLRQGLGGTKASAYRAMLSSATSTLRVLAGAALKRTSSTTYDDPHRFVR